MVRYLNDNKFLQLKERFLRRATSNLKRTAHFNWGIKHQEVKAQMVKRYQTNEKQFGMLYYHYTCNFTRRNYQWEKLCKEKDRILLVRRLDEATTKKAMKPLFQIEHEWEFSRESSGTQTKDGVANAVSGLEVTLSLSGLASRDDENLYMKDAVEDGILMEFLGC